MTGLKKIIITAGSLPEAEAALKLAQTDGEQHACLTISKHACSTSSQHVCCIGSTKLYSCLVCTVQNACKHACQVSQVVFACAERLYCTVGVHPTRCQEIEDSSDGPEAYWDALQVLLKGSVASGKVVAIGECGLDYDRYAHRPFAAVLRFSFCYCHSYTVIAALTAFSS